MKHLFKGDHGPLLIAEIGGNHEGDFEYAKRLTHLAIESGVDCIKFQIYTGDTLVSSAESPDRNKHFKKFELTNGQHIELAEMIQTAGKIYLSSVWNPEAMNWIDPYMPFYKVGSGDLTTYPVLRAIAKLGKPIILSTGLSNEEEVLESVRFIQSVDKKYKSREWLGLLQCTSMYPINASDAHLNVMSRLKELTGLTIGYSDHTVGSDALKLAAAMGAEILEFHFTDKREGKSFRDHMVSLTKDEVSDLTDFLEEMIELKGENIKKTTPIEVENGHVTSFRRAVYPSRNISEGEFLNEDNLTVLRPNHGIDARFYFDLIGKRINQNVQKHEKLTWEMIKDDTIKH